VRDSSVCNARMQIAGSPTAQEIRTTHQGNGIRE
jgi:hypothetical protein